jgi:pyruvate carboxylase
MWKVTANHTISAEADEAYVIGKRGQYTPVGAYLAGDEIIKIALQHGVQMIHPGMDKILQLL